MKRAFLSLYLFTVSFTLFCQPTNFNLIAPANYSEDVDIWPVFQWSASTDPSGVIYTLQISTSPQFKVAQTVSYDSLTISTYRPAVDLIMGQNLYYWRVLAISGNGDTTMNNSNDFPFNFFQFQTIPSTEPREVLGAEPLPFDRTLIKENKPYTIRQGNLVIPQNKCLTIKSGVIVNFEDSYYIQVDGTIKLLGEINDTIEFNGPWQQISWGISAPNSVFDASNKYVSGSIIRYSKFNNCNPTNAVLYAPSTSVYLSNSFINGATNQGIYIESNSIVDSCFLYNCKKAGYLNPGWKTNVYGGGLYILGNNNIIRDNKIIQCCITFNYNVDGNLYGAGMFINGDLNNISNNYISGCDLYDLTNYKTSLITTYGGGICCAGANNRIVKNIITNNFGNLANKSYPYRYGGGVFNSGINNIIDSCTISSNKSTYGGGIFSSQDLVINHSTITNNIATETGSGVYAVNKIFNSTITYNQGNCAIYPRADSINFCNIYNNQGYQIHQDSPTGTYAVNNWWNTRSDEVAIESSIFDGYDNSGGTGFVTYQPFLTDISPTTPGKFTDANQLLLTDKTYSNVLNSDKVCLLDTIYFKMTGIDNNHYSRDIAVLKVFNKQTWNQIRPFYEETTDSSGIWKGYFILAAATKLPDKIAVNLGDTLRVSVDVDPDIYSELIIGPKTPLAANSHSICENDTAYLTATGENIRWYSDSLLTHLVIESDTVVVEKPNSGMYTYFVTQITDGIESAPLKVVLTVHSLPQIDLGVSHSTCQGVPIQIDAPYGFNSYLWNTGSTENSVTVADSGFYSCRISDAFGCANIDSVYLSVLPIYNIAQDITICQGESYNGHLESGSYTENLITSNGCDSIVTTHLTVKPIFSRTDYISICQGDSYKGHTGSETFTENLKSQFGCDSIIITHLTVHSVYNYSQDLSICQGESYNGHTSTGIYTDEFQTASGCDSIITTHLTVNPVYNYTDEITVCQGESYKGHSETGVFTEYLKSSAGCDSTVTTHLTVKPIYSHTENISICEGDSYKGHTENGSFTENLKTMAGCDSIITTHLQVNSVYNYSQDITICQGDSYNGHTSTGTYIDEYQSESGCDSIATTNLTVNPVYNYTNDISICEGESYKGHTETGIFTENLKTASGCDSIVTTHLTVNPVYNLTNNVSICEGDGYKGHTESGSFIENLKTFAGCDSIITTHLLVNEVYNYSQDITICQGDSYNGHTSTGTYTENFKTVQGCDSIVKTILKVNKNYTRSDSIAICKGESYRGFTSSGKYEELFLTTSGCDSIINTVLTVEQKPFLFIDQNQKICSGDTIELKIIGNGILTWIGFEANPIKVSPKVNSNYTAFGYNECGDTSSVINVDVLQKPTTPTISNENGILVSSISSGNQWFGLDGIIEGANGMNYEPTTDGTYFVIASNGNCVSDTSNLIEFSKVTTIINDKDVDLILYPNPVQNSLLIKSNEEIESLTIIDISGRYVLTFDKIFKDEISLDLSNIISGFYLMRIEFKSRMIPVVLKEFTKE